MAKTVVALSGGIDSTTLVARYVAYGWDVHAVSFKYGSKHNFRELRAAKRVVEEYNIAHIVVDMRPLFEPFKSNLLAGKGEIPEGHYTDESMKKTVVPGRNTLFAAFLMGYAQSIGAKWVALAVHQGDHAIYPDCRPAWAVNMNQVVQVASEYEVTLETPFLYYTKTTIVAEGLALEAPYHLTWTCYKGEMLPCGVCGACVERKEAFESNNAKDPAWIKTQSNGTALTK